MANSNNKKCFVIMPISDADGYDKGHFNRVYEYLIKPACEEAGFEPIRADDTSKANMIMVDVLHKILECDIAICDLSSRNPNVFYELGFRQAFNKKTVLIKDSKTMMPFDISGIRTLPYSESLRIDEVKKTIPEIAKYITETINAEDKDVNSLLQLLSVEKPAALPEKVNLSQDSRMILNAIRELSDKFEVYSNQAPYIRLNNNELVALGETVYDKMNGHEELGEVIKITPTNIVVNSQNGSRISINRNSKKFSDLTTIPF